MTSWGIADYVDGWVDGWARARAAPRPERLEGGWYVATDSAGEPGRYVLSEPTPDRLAAILEGEPSPGTCVLLPGDPEEWLLRFGAGWHPTHEGCFMTRALGRPPGRKAPPGYEVTVDPAPTVVVACVLAPEGNVVATGRMGFGASYAVADRIETDDRHRRLGLGTVVMAELERHALDAGLERAVLGATGNGRALYSRLGWDEGARLAGAVRRAD